MNPVFISVRGYPNACRLKTIGTERHVTACLASIPADEPVLITAAEPADLCSACREDLRVRRGRGEDLGPCAGAAVADVSIEPTVQAAEEMFGPAVAGTTTPDLRGQRTIPWDEVGGFDAYNDKDQS